MSPGNYEHVMKPERNYYKHQIKTYNRPMHPEDTIVENVKNIVNDTLKENPDITEILNEIFPQNNVTENSNTTIPQTLDAHTNETIKTVTYLNNTVTNFETTTINGINDYMHQHDEGTESNYVTTLIIIIVIALILIIAVSVTLVLVYRSYKKKGFQEISGWNSSYQGQQQTMRQLEEQICTTDCETEQSALRK